MHLFRHYICPELKPFLRMYSWYSIAKAMHLIGMVSWMAGMFYLVRIMVYHAMAFDKTGPERSVMTQQFSMMEWKSYNVIIKPAVVITWAFGVIMLCIQPVWLQEAWMHLKLALLVLLTGYTHSLKNHIRKLENETSERTHLYYRALNEVPTIFLVAVVFLAVFKSNINYFYWLTGIALFTGLIAWGIKKANSK